MNIYVNISRRLFSILLRPFHFCFSFSFLLSLPLETRTCGHLVPSETNVYMKFYMST